MIPEEINIQINLLNEQAQIFSSSQRWMTVLDRREEVDDIKDQIAELNDNLNEIFEEIENILSNALLTEFELDTLVEDLKDNSVFLELNPRLVYEEEQLEFEKQRIIEEEKINSEIKKLEVERIQKFNQLCFDGPNEIQKIQEFIGEGLDINKIEISLWEMLEHGRSKEFIYFLVKNGFLVTKQDIVYLTKHKTYENKRMRSNLFYARNIELEAIKEIGIIREKELKENKIKRLKIILLIVTLAIGVVLFIVFFDQIAQFINKIFKIFLLALVILFFLFLSSIKSKIR